MLKRALDRQAEQRDPIGVRFVGASAVASPLGTIRQIKRMKAIRTVISPTAHWPPRHQEPGRCPTQCARTQPKRLREATSRQLVNRSL